MADDPSERIATLEARCAALEAQVAALLAQVEHARAGGFRSMALSRTCPACGGGHLVHVRGATQATDMSVLPFGLAHDMRWSGLVTRGPLESIACRRCGLVEWRVSDFSNVVVDGAKVVAVDPEPDAPRGGPFR